MKESGNKIKPKKKRKAKKDVKVKILHSILLKNLKTLAAGEPHT